MHISVWQWQWCQDFISDPAASLSSKNMFRLVGRFFVCLFLWHDREELDEMRVALMATWRLAKEEKEIPEGDTEAPPPPHFCFLRRVSFWRILGNEKCYKNNVDRDSVSVSRISIICSRNCICRWLDMQTEYSWASKICHHILPRPFKLPYLSLSKCVGGCSIPPEQHFSAMMFCLLISRHE